MAKYRSTPKRRAALHKAQLASAKKRRRTRNKRIGTALGIAGTIAGITVFGAVTRSKVKGRRNAALAAAASAPEPVKLSTSTALDIIRTVPFTDNTGKNNWKIVGRPVKRTVVGKAKRKRPTYVEWEQKRIRGLARRERKADKQRQRYHRGDIPNKQPVYRGTPKNKRRARPKGMFNG